MKKYFHEYTEQELTTMPVEELNDIRNHVFSEDGTPEGVKAEMSVPEKCQHGGIALFCKPCFQEVHSSLLEMRTQEAKELAIDLLYLGEETISIPEMFHQMWTEESTIMYNVYSPEFLRHT